MKKFLIVLGLSLLVSPTNAFAVAQNGSSGSSTQSGTASQTTTGNQNSTSNKGVANAIKNCEKIEARIQTKMQNYATSKKKFITAYDNIVSRIDKIIIVAKENNYDTTKLEADLATFESMLDEFKAGMDESYAQLERTQQYTCGESEGQFMGALTQSRNQLQNAHQKAVELRTFYKETLKIDLLALKDEIASSTSADTNTADESSTTDDATSNEE